MDLVRGVAPRAHIASLLRCVRHPISCVPTTTAADFCGPRGCLRAALFQASATPHWAQQLPQISPSKNADLPRAIVRSTPSFFGCVSFAGSGPLALILVASYRLRVPRPAGSFQASFGRSVTSPPLPFPSFAATCLREDFHLQDSAHVGRTALRAWPIGPAHGASRSTPSSAHRAAWVGLTRGVGNSRIGFAYTS